MHLHSSEEEAAPSKQKRKAADAKTANLKAELKQLLKQPLVAQGVSTRYITSGSVSVADEMIAGQCTYRSACCSLTIISANGWSHYRSRDYGRVEEDGSWKRPGASQKAKAETSKTGVRGMERYRGITQSGPYLAWTHPHMDARGSYRVAATTPCSTILLVLLPVLNFVVNRHYSDPVSPT